MSTYELDDDLVRVWIQDLREGLGDEGSKRLANSLEEQLPLPVPTKIGAVVQATHNTSGVFTRWDTDEQADHPWIDSTDGEHVSTERLGRVTKVHSEGVDL